MRCPNCAREFVAESCGSHLGDGQSSRGYNQSRRTELPGIRLDDILRGSPHLAHGTRDKHLHPHAAALILQHIRDVSRRPVTEQLAQGFLVIRNAVTFDQGYELRRWIPRENRLGKVRVG